MNHGAIETYQRALPLASRLYIYGQLPALSLFRRPPVAWGWRGTSQWLGFDEPKLPLISHFFLVTISRKFLMGIFLPLSNFPLLKGLIKVSHQTSYKLFHSYFNRTLLEPSLHDLLNLTKSFYLRHKALFSAFIISSPPAIKAEHLSLRVRHDSDTETQFPQKCGPRQFASSVGWQSRRLRWKSDKCTENGKLKITLPVNSANNNRSLMQNVHNIILEMRKLRLLFTRK